jgi:hypothetical protein
MSCYSHCQECGRKVTSAYFCRKCEGAFCTLHCLQQHIKKHTAAAVVAITPDLAPPADELAPRPSVAAV